ncbi:MAG: Mut7-C RNAse domain-containing protein [Anaerolineae bacterium]
MFVEPELRFVADAMLGRLARWLRLLGYDTLYQASWDDPYLVRLARAEGRVLLTRDTDLAMRRGVRVLFVHSEAVEEQLEQLHRELGVWAREPFSRCPVCNALLERVTKDRAWGMVPPYVFMTQNAFRVCPVCDRFYWRGTHWDHMIATIDKWSA